MAKYFAAIVFILLILGTYFFLKDIKDSYRILPLEEVQSPPLNVEAYSFQNWQDYSPPDGAFEVLFPTRPISAKENVQDPTTKQTRKYDMHVSEKNDGTIFMVTRITFVVPPGIKDPQELMNQMAEDMLNSNPQNLLHLKQNTSYREHEALDFAFGNDETTVHARTFVEGNTLYVLSRLSKVRAADDREYQFFLNSFDLITSQK